jgi:Predicted acetyltransferase
MSNYSVVTDTSVETFFSHAGELLYQHEDINGLMVGILENWRGKEVAVAPLLLRVVDERGETVTAAVNFRKNPMNIIFTLASDEQLRVIAEYLKNSDEKFTGFVGPRREVRKFADIWEQMTSAKTDLSMGQLIYKIENVTFPEGVLGEMRVATHEELPLVFQWSKAFIEEAMPADKRTDKEWQDFAELVIARQGAHLWYVNGKPVAQAVWSRPTRNGVSISGVYTPPELRKRGYASAVVAALSQKMLEQGRRFCVLYTDASNPTSNKIYQNIGYREVCESLHLTLK